MNPQERQVARIQSRIRVGEIYNPTKFEIAGVISRNAQFLEGYVNFHQDPKYLREVLLAQRYSSLLQSYNGKNPSGAAISVSAVLNMSDILGHMSVSNQDQGDHVSYLYFDDLSGEIESLADKIVKADQALKLGQDFVVRRLEEDLKQALSAVASIDAINSGLTIFRAELSDGTAFLTEDPSGFLLVEESEKRVKGEKSRFRAPREFVGSGGVPEFSAIGVNLGARAYKMAYEILRDINADDFLKS